MSNIIADTIGSVLSFGGGITSTIAENMINVTGLEDPLLITLVSVGIFTYAYFMLISKFLFEIETLGVTIKFTLLSTFFSFVFANDKKELSVAQNIIHGVDIAGRSATFLLILLTLIIIYGAITKGED